MPALSHTDDTPGTTGKAPARRTQPRGDRARYAILCTAMAVATVDGLDGLSLSQLATKLGVSKAGLFAHFASKEELQLATVDFAAERFEAVVVQPALTEANRLVRIWRCHQLRLDWIAAADLPGGCFFANAEFEFDMKPGPVRDRLAGHCAGWLAFLIRLVESAKRAGDLRADVDARQLAFEIDAFGLAAIYRSRLISDDSAYPAARTAVLHRLRALATDPAPLPQE
jgi:AcrR family transcriptional regulator